MLGVQTESLEQYGAVSEAVAREMAWGICQQSGSDIGISMTGIAGPTGGSAEKPVGLAYVGLCKKTMAGVDAVQVEKIMVNAKYPRREIKHWFSQYALHFLRHFLR